MDGSPELKEGEGSEEVDGIKLDVDPSKFPTGNTKVEVETK